MLIVYAQRVLFSETGVSLRDTYDITQIGVFARSINPDYTLSSEFYTQQPDRAHTVAIQHYHAVIDSLTRFDHAYLYGDQWLPVRDLRHRGRANYCSATRVLNGFWSYDVAVDLVARHVSSTDPGMANVIYSATSPELLTNVRERFADSTFANGRGVHTTTLWHEATAAELLEMRNVSNVGWEFEPDAQDPWQQRYGDTLVIEHIAEPVEQQEVERALTSRIVFDHPYSANEDRLDVRTRERFQRLRALIPVPDTLATLRRDLYETTNPPPQHADMGALDEQAKRPPTRAENIEVEPPKEKPQVC